LLSKDKFRGPGVGRVGLSRPTVGGMGGMGGMGGTVCRHIPSILFKGWLLIFPREVLVRNLSG
jgi:hypothetical protein